MVLTYFDADLVDGRCRRFLGIDVNEAGILGDHLAKFPHFFIKGCRAHHGLMGLGHKGQQGFNILAKALAQHFVHFVKDKVSYAAKARVALAQVVQEATWRPHKDVGLIAQFPPFFVIVLAAAHGKDADWRAVSKLLDFTCRLLGQLPCRGKNEGLDEGLYFRNFCKKRHDKGKGLPHPRLGAANDVPSLQKGGDGAFLHRRRNILSSLMESFNKRRRNRKLSKTTWHGGLSLPIHQNFMFFIIY